MAAHAKVHAVLQVCGIANAAVRNLLIQNEGFDTLEDIAVMEEDRDVSEMAKRAAQRTVADGRVLLGTVQIKRMQGLVWWLHDRIEASSAVGCGCVYRSGNVHRDDEENN